MYYKEEYMNVRDLKKLEMENLSNGGRAILDAVGPSYEYRNGQKTDKFGPLDRRRFLLLSVFFCRHDDTIIRREK